MDYEELIPARLRHQFNWLGTAPKDWFAVRSADGVQFVVNIELSHLLNHGTPPMEVLAALHRSIKSHDYVDMMYMEACSKVMTDGPKLFRPTEEQWEALENVSIDLPVQQMRAPYSCMFVSIPAKARERLARTAQVPLSDFPSMVLVRHREAVEGQVSYLFFMSNFTRHTMFNVMYAETDSTIDESLSRRNYEYLKPEDHLEYEVSVAMNRAVANCCLLLTTYEHRLDPLPAAKNREETRRLKREGIREVRFVQEVIVRRTANGERGDNHTGAEVAVHWRRGHFRAKPGFGDARSRGEKVPLVFVRPCIVRGDRGAPPAELTMEVRS